MDKQILNEITKIEKELKLIENYKKGSLLTNCTYKLNGETINLHVQNSTGPLINIYSDILQKEFFYEKARAALKSKATLLIYGFTPEDWKEDLETISNYLRIKEREKVLRSCLVRLNSILSKEEKDKQEFENILKLLQNV